MFYEIYAKLCASKGISPSRAAGEIGFSKSTVSHWRSSGNMPGQQLLSRLSDYFAIDVEQLLLGGGELPESQDGTTLGATAPPDSVTAAPEASPEQDLLTLTAEPDTNATLDATATTVAATPADAVAAAQEASPEQDLLALTAEPDTSATLDATTSTVTATPPDPSIEVLQNNAQSAATNVVAAFEITLPPQRAQSLSLQPTERGSHSMERQSTRTGRAGILADNAFTELLRPNTNESFGRRLKKLRRSLRASAADVAFEVGVSREVYDAWEDDREKPRAYRLQRLATVLGVSVSALNPPELLSGGALTREGLLSLLETLKDRDECLALLALAQKSPQHLVQSAIELLS